jgi:hypothetical protein
VEEVAAEEAPPLHVVYGLGRGPPPEPDAPPGLGVNSLGALESWSRATTARSLKMYFFLFFLF